ncbi:MAG: phosphonate metabolism transcriptional regulator PhnF [Rhodospirillales bacterium]|jgi:GntR family phosphonate transport system transcriptional regulator|nr:phosphonate metabolism transcriptional regulator PhnF [Rhodospirillales bacterium]
MARPQPTQDDVFVAAHARRRSRATSADPQPLEPGTLVPGDATRAAAPVRGSGVALWRQIAGDIESAIADGRLPPGARLPTEGQLAQRYAVNRHTVRRALEELARGGQVRVEQGRGSFVAEDVLDYAISARTRFSEWIRRHHREPAGRVLSLVTMPAPRAIAEALGIPPGEAIARLERLGLADGRPVCLAWHHFALARLPDIAAALAAHATISAALAAVGVADYVRRVTRVTARLPRPEEAALLATPRSRPLLVTESINVDRRGQVVEFGLACYPTPRVQIVFEPGS